MGETVAGHIVHRMLQLMQLDGSVLATLCFSVKSKIHLIKLFSFTKQGNHTFIKERGILNLCPDSPRASLSTPDNYFGFNARVLSANALGPSVLSPAYEIFTKFFHLPYSF